MKKEIFIRSIDFIVGIDKCKNVVGVVRYPWCHTLWEDGITNNEDIAEHILKHDWLGKNNAKNEDGIQHACFPWFVGWK